MPSTQVKRCPQCGNTFQPRRKNQDYCSTECRTDFNNAAAKVRYTAFKKEAPRVTAVHQELKQLKQYLASLTILLIDRVTEVDSKTITYQGRTYNHTAMLDGSVGGVMLSRGGAVLLPNGHILYRNQNSSSIRWSGRYVLEE